MATFSKSTGTFLIQYNHLVEQYKRGLFCLSSKEVTEVGGLLIASEIESEDYFEFSLARYLPKKKYAHGMIAKTMLKYRAHIFKNYYTFSITIELFTIFFFVRSLIATINFVACSLDVLLYRNCGYKKMYKYFNVSIIQYKRSMNM